MRSNSERNERLLEGLKTSLGAKEIEIDKLYVRLRQEVENAERQCAEKVCDIFSHDDERNTSKDTFSVLIFLVLGSLL